MSRYVELNSPRRKILLWNNFWLKLDKPRR